MGLPADERMDLHVHPGLKRLVQDRAGDRTLNVEVSALICAALGLDPRDYPVPRKKMGRPVGWRKPQGANGKRVKKKPAGS